MGLATHLVRREAVYYWRRKLPAGLAAFQNHRHALISLRTRDPELARRFAVRLDAAFEDVRTACELGSYLTRHQLDAMLRQVVATHMDKLDRVAAAAKANPGFDAERARRDDRRAAGLTDDDIAAVDDHPAMVDINRLVPTRPDIRRADQGGGRDRAGGSGLVSRR
jgi:hypothetical protein